MKLPLYLLVLLIGCKISSDKADDLKDDIVVGSTSVSLRLPRAADVTSGNTTANVYALSVSPLDGCNGSQITRLGEYNSGRITVTIKSQCSYEVYLEVGTGKGRLETTFYGNNEAYEIRKNSLKVSALDISVSLDLQSGGRDNGFERQIIQTP